MGRPGRVYCAYDQGHHVHHAIYVDTMDHSTFPFRPVDEPRLERFVAAGFSKYVNHGSSGSVTEQIKQYFNQG